MAHSVLHARNKNFATLLVNMGKTVRKARITSKQRRSWCAREKLMVVCYHEHGHSVKKTADLINLTLYHGTLQVSRVTI